MSRKKKHEHVNHERWLVSYADFITLLFAFFVVLFASGQADKKKQQRFASAMNQAFSQMAIFEPHAKTPALGDSGAGENPNAPPKPVELPIEADGSGDSDKRMREDMRERVQKLVDQQVAKGGLKLGDVTVRAADPGVALSLHEGGFFDSGSAVIRPEATAALEAIAGAVPAGGIRVEGHTDNQPMHSTLYASNWELSSARASAIARFLLEHSGVNPSEVAVAGYAEFHPVASNATAEGRAQNRRVDIVFLGQKAGK
jgi:chemotaxis protein MotB